MLRAVLLAFGRSTAYNLAPAGVPRQHWSHASPLRKRTPSSLLSCPLRTPPNGAHHSSPLLTLPPPSSQECPASTYSLNPNSKSCEPCPVGASCTGGATLQPQPGWWHSSPFTPQMHRCPNPAACDQSRRNASSSGSSDELPPPAQVCGLPHNALGVKSRRRDVTLTLLTVCETVHAETTQQVVDGHLEWTGQV